MQSIPGVSLHQKAFSCSLGSPHSPTLLCPLGGETQGLIRGPPRDRAAVGILGHPNSATQDQENTGECTEDTIPFEVSKGEPQPKDNLIKCVSTTEERRSMHILTGKCLVVTLGTFHMRGKEKCSMTVSHQHCILSPVYPQVYFALQAIAAPRWSGLSLSFGIFLSSQLRQSRGQESFLLFLNSNIRLADLPCVSN